MVLRASACGTASDEFLTLNDETEINESLILAQNQRWRRASDMQVERLKLSSESA